MKRPLVALGILALTLAVLGGCPGPAQYATQLAVCTETSKSWEEYVPCCSAVARGAGRDPSFCLPDRDADALVPQLTQDSGSLADAAVRPSALEQQIIDDMDASAQRSLALLDAGLEALKKEAGQ